MILHSNAILRVLWIMHLKLDFFVLISCYCSSVNFSHTSFIAKRVEAVQTLCMVCIQPYRIHFCLYGSKSFLFSSILFRVSMHWYVWWIAIAIISVGCWGVWQKWEWKSQALEGWDDWISCSSKACFQFSIESDFVSIFILLAQTYTHFWLVP